MTEIYESKPLGDIMNGFTLGGPKAPVPKVSNLEKFLVMLTSLTTKSLSSLPNGTSDANLPLSCGTGRGYRPERYRLLGPRLCDRGIESLEHKRELVGEHITLQLTGSPGAFNFLDRRFKGQPPVKGCKTDDVVTSLLG